MPSTTTHGVGDVFLIHYACLGGGFQCQRGISSSASTMHMDCRWRCRYGCTRLSLSWPVGMRGEERHGILGCITGEHKTSRLPDSYRLFSTILRYLEVLTELAPSIEEESQFYIRELPLRTAHDDQMPESRMDRDREDRSVLPPLRISPPPTRGRSARMSPPLRRSRPATPEVQMPESSVDRDRVCYLKIILRLSFYFIC
ncbi:uncharacterized protein LOC111406788 [Olea europaea var. sylvestris]|uniref:uncharacterized protein LOC111406788 n=1 Tax=Olea europaea var. sylvestris TaxID=158386 RepID=UPI000C1D57BF|nr:uncharacterized protein LOC111406788 [Olea europaea var. sylvestris]